MRDIDLKAERDFENRRAKGGDMRKKQTKYYWATHIPIQRHNLNSFQKIKGKKILEIGCASGNDAISYTKYAAFYCGLDISDEAIRNANRLNLKNSEFLCVDGHKIPKGDEEFDCVVVNSLLHHLDLLKSFKEIHRVLKSDGYLIFREPLGTNPFFQIYRHFTPSARTPDERPFTFSDVRLMKSFFDLKEVQWFGFFSIISAFFQWKILRKFLTFIDFSLSKTPLKIFFWQFSGFAMKKENNNILR